MKSFDPVFAIINRIAARLILHPALCTRGMQAVMTKGSRTPWTLPASWTVQKIPTSRGTLRSLLPIGFRSVRNRSLAFSKLMTFPVAPQIGRHLPPPGI